ncbi:MAG: sugar transferase [Acidobacteria bacterium]|nr:sugar transferase [Acidobacteriota bacterium]
MNATVLTFTGVPAATIAARRRRTRDVYVLGETLFVDAVQRERRRADRTATPFAVLVLDMTHTRGSAPWPSVLRAAAAVRRDVDAVGWLEADAVLGILLPDVTLTCAMRVMRHLRRHLSQHLGEAASGVVSMRLYIHGLELDAEGPALPPVDLLLDAFAPERAHVASAAAKRALDVVGSAALLLLFSPVMLVAWALVKWTSKGPALFRQSRIGRRGEPFTMLKFRSMRVDAGHAVHDDYVTWFITASGKEPRKDGVVYKLTNDPRITPVGNVLRKTSLDELPQFFNVLRGEMSLVGPRPPLPSEVDMYQPWHRRRVLEAKPGITGLWQVNGRSRTTFDEMVRMDLQYARTRTLWGDLKILAATPFAMVKGAA